MLERRRWRNGGKKIVVKRNSQCKKGRGGAIRGGSPPLYLDSKERERGEGKGRCPS